MPSNVMRGILLSTLAFAAFTCFDTTVKYLAQEYSVFQIMGLECLVAAVLVVGWMVLTGEHKAARGGFTIRPARYLLARALLQLISNVLFFIAFTHMKLTEFYVILFTIPMTVMLLSAFLLREKITWVLLVALVLSFIGVLVALRPQEGLNAWALLCFVGTFFSALGLITLRKIPASHSPAKIALMVNLVMALGTLAPALSVYVQPGLADLGLMALGGFFFAAGQILVSQGVRLAGASWGVAPQFLQLIWGALAGYFVFGDVPASTVYGGGALVIAANIFLMMRAGKT